MDELLKILIQAKNAGCVSVEIDGQIIRYIFKESEKPSGRLNLLTIIPDPEKYKGENNDKKN